MQTRRRQALTRAARQLCSSCPLWAQCLWDSVTQSDPGGYAAGTTRQDRRWIRRDIGLGDAQGRLTAAQEGEDPPVGVEVVVNAFDALQEHRTSRTGRTSRAAGPAAAGSRAGTGHDPGADVEHRVAGGARPPAGQQSVNTHEVSMVAPTSQRITFSLDDPARAIQEAVLGPLVHSTLPALDTTRQIAAMLVRAPGGGITPQLLDGLGRAHGCLEAWRTAAGDAFSDRPPVRGLTGSVGIELATSDPLAALRQDIFEPLLHRLAESIRHIKALTAMLSDAPEGGIPDGTVPNGRELAALYVALCELDVHIEQYAPLAPRAQPPAGPGEAVRRGSTLRSVPDAPPAGMLPPASWSAPSLRQAVEQAVASFPGPFSGRDVLAALPPGTYQDPAKSVSNALSAMAKSGRLLRLSRGTYAVVSPSTGAIAASS
ncbi:WhiB family transcriptional regulator [Streptomyces sp. NPDC054854]